MACADLKIPTASEHYGVNEGEDTPETRTEDLFSQDGDNPPPASGERQLGLDILRPLGWSGSAHSDYDVVTVHGIRDDYKTAWTDEDGAWWLKNRLFKGLSIREVDYSYEIDEEATIFEADDRASLKETEINRPIIWICHDLGGTIVKEALCRAINNSKEYGKVAILTTTIIFLGTPHRFLSTEDRESQVHNLLRLPGPNIRSGFLNKIRNLASHVNRINEDFLATKLLDRATIFNVYVQNRRDNLRRGHAEGDDGTPEVDDQEDIPDPVTPFSLYTHTIGHSFEGSRIIRINWTNHVDLIRGDNLNERWIPRVSNMLNEEGCIIRINYQLLQFQTHILSLAPPTRSLDIKPNPLLPISPVLKWVYNQPMGLSLSGTGVRPRLMHLYTDGLSLIDVREIFGHLYLDFDANNDGENLVIYFEFDQWDSRYNNISSMLIYFINAMMWHFWNFFPRRLFFQELNFLNDTRGWSLEDLYHLYTTMRFYAPRQLIFFLSGFDQCPEEQQRWFLERVLEEQSYSEAKYRLILSSSTPNGLAVKNIPGAVRINMDDYPAISTLGERFAKELETELVDLLKKRPIYEEFRQQLEILLQGCENTPCLRHVIFTWLRNYPRGRPKSEIATRISEMSPPTAENIARVIVSSLTPQLRERAENVFNWVKHALEPWSPKSLAEALAVFYSPDQEPCFIDLHTGGIIEEIVMSLCGIIIIKGNDVRFSHSSFYLASPLGVGQSNKERAAKVNSALAEVCLRYLQLGNPQDEIMDTCSKIIEGNNWNTPIDAVMVSQSRASMAEYAVRFWPLHYEPSGQFKPKHLVLQLFATTKARCCWETFAWLLSNPFTRSDRGYISVLPTFAKLGLHDLVDESIKLETGQSSFNKDCWMAITEAARMGQSDTVRKLLQHVSVDEEELQTALLLGAANGNEVTLSILVEKIPRLEAFQWPKHLFHRASAIGLGSLLTLMLQSGYDINRLSGFYQSPPVTLAAWRNCVSSVGILLRSEFKADLSIKDESEDTLLTCAVCKGNPRVIQMILEAGGNGADKDGSGTTLTQIAVYSYMHKAADMLIRAGADFNSGKKKKSHNIRLKPPLIIAAKIGALECARILLKYGADPLISCDTGAALYEAVANNHIEIAQLLLEQEQKPDLDAHPPKEEMLLMRAIDTGNADLVSMLIDYGVDVEFVDPNCGFNSTPLSRACEKGSLDIVKRLLEKNVDINYTGGLSSSPLFAAIFHRKDKVVRYLLQNERIDVYWSRANGVNALIAAYRSPETVRELLKRGVSIDHYSSWGTILHMAASRWPKTIRALLEHVPKPDLECVCGDDMEVESDIGCTPLQIACQNQTPECVELLLDAGANAKFRNKNGVDAVDILLQTNRYTKDTEQCLRLILSQPGQFNPEDINAKDQTRLHMITESMPLAIVQLLVKAKVPLDRPDKNGYTPLVISIREGNTKVTKYLIDQGASAMVFSPNYDSILHLAVTKGTVELVKQLIGLSWDCEAVDPNYGASLLYTALEIKDSSELQKMVRYLVDEVKVPIDKLGGEFSYPIIKAADMTRTDYKTGIKMLKFLIRRKAQLDVADSQGRRAVHLACTSRRDDGIRSLTEAGAEINVEDKFGRMPIHFAASPPSSSCVEYLLETQKHMDINVADHDGWTPLLWAARSGHASTITRLIAEKEDVWARGRVDRVGNEWSALKLMNFSGRNTALREELKPKTPIRINGEGEQEEWNDDLHDMRAGHQKNVACKSCLVNIIGFAWECITCPDNFLHCFKCYSHRSDIHNSKHVFRAIKPFFSSVSSSAYRRNTAGKDEGQGNLGGSEAENAPDADVDEDGELDASKISDQDDFDLDDLDDFDPDAYY